MSVTGVTGVRSVTGVRRVWGVRVLIVSGL